MEREEREQCYVFRTLLTLRQLCEDQEASPSSALLSHANALQSNSQTIQITLCNGTALHDSRCTHIFVAKIDPRRNDRAREDPFRDIERDIRLYLSRPSIESEEVDGRESIDAIDGNGDGEGDPEISVCKRCPAGCGFEIIETLFINISTSIPTGEGLIVK